MSEEKKTSRLNPNVVLKRAQKLFVRKAVDSTSSYKDIFKTYESQAHKHDKNLEQHKKHSEKELKTLTKQHQDTRQGLEQSLSTQQEAFNHELTQAKQQFDAQKSRLETSFKHAQAPIEEQIKTLNNQMATLEATDIKVAKPDKNTQESIIASIILESQKPLKAELERLLKRLTKSAAYDANERVIRVRYIDQQLNQTTQREADGITSKIQNLQHALADHQENYVANFERLEHIMSEGTKTFDDIADLLLNYQSQHQQHHKPVLAQRSQFTKDAQAQNKKARQDVLRLLNVYAQKAQSPSEKQFFKDYIQLYESLDLKRSQLYKTIDASLLKVLQQVDGEMARIYDALDQQVHKQKKFWHESAQAFFDALKIYQLDAIDVSLAEKLLLRHVSDGLKAFFDTLLGIVIEFQQNRHTLLETFHHKAQTLFDALDDQQLFLDAYWQNKQLAYEKAKAHLDIQAQQLGLAIEKLKLQHEWQLYDFDKQRQLLDFEQTLSLHQHELERKEAVAKLTHAHHVTLDKHEEAIQIAAQNYALKKGSLTLEIDLWRDKLPFLEAEVNEKADRLIQEIHQRQERTLKDLIEQNDLQYDAYNLSIENLQQQIKQTVKDQEDLIKEIRHEALDDVKDQYDSIYAKYQAVTENIDNIETKKAHKAKGLDEVFLKETQEARQYIADKKAVLSTRLHELDISYKDILNQVSHDRQTLQEERRDIKALLLLCSQEHYDLLATALKNITLDAIAYQDHLTKAQLEDRLSFAPTKLNEATLHQKNERYLKQAHTHEANTLSALEKAFEQTRKKILSKGRDNIQGIRSLLEQLVNLQEQTLKTETERIMNEMKQGFKELTASSESFIESTQKRADKLKDKVLLDYDKELKKFVSEEQTLKRTIDKIEAKILKKAKGVAQSKLDDYEQRLSQLNAKIEKIKHDRDEHQKNFEREEKRFNEQFDTEKADVDHQRGKNLQNTRENHRQHLLLLEQRLSEALEVYDQFETSKQETIAFDKKQHTHALQELAQMYDDRLGHLEKKFSQRKEDLDKAVQQSKETLQAQLKDINDDITAYTQKLEQAQDTIDHEFEEKKHLALEAKKFIKSQLKELDEEAHDQINHLIEQLHLALQKHAHTSKQTDLLSLLEKTVKEVYQKQHTLIDQFIQKTSTSLKEDLEKEAYDGE